MSRSPRIGFVSLGCPKALVDSERILSRLHSEGYRTSSNYEDADLVVVNTCGFIDSAREESLSAIAEALSENGRVIVTGCLGAKPELIREKHENILAITGPHQIEAVLSAIHRVLPPPHDPFVDLIPPQGIKLTPRHYSYLKISEGCNHHCSFCIIPQLRGRLVSRPIDEVLREAETLVDAGTRELLVISQDTSAYGVDLGYAEAPWRDRMRPARLTALCEALGELGVWVRLHYVYPYPHVDELMPLMADGKLLPYLDVPFQHASNRILKAMRRPAAEERTLERIRQWRKQVPALTLRSTFIVGFPGETQADFESLLNWLDAAELDRVGCFKYEPVSGAAANALPDAVPDDLKEERWHRLMSAQQAISARRLQQRVGGVISVLVDEIDGDDGIGRSQGDAPEIDGKVFLRGRNLSVGALVDAEVVRAGEYDLWATAIEA
ncbi:MAG TPA: 30S ribosomal protein S12 methylthiotransferase RimO [Gammaproteobacteria bacterium]